MTDPSKDTSSTAGLAQRLKSLIEKTAKKIADKQTERALEDFVRDYEEASG